MKMHLSKKISTEKRFTRLLAHQTGDRPLYDTPVMESQTWVVAPSLGALLPGWLIILPRRAALNFRQWAKAGGDPFNVLAEVGAALGLERADYIWFEHGPRTEGTAVGCGVDYAHIHMLIRPPFSFDDFVTQLRSDDRVCWRNVSPSEIYAEPALAGSYFAVGHGDRALMASEVEEAGSQYIRRAVARLVGMDSAWNYREFPHHQNIKKTVDLVHGMRDAVRR